jgi:hypothetical protein
MCKRKKGELYSPLDRNRRDIPMTVDKRLSVGTVPLELEVNCGVLGACVVDCEGRAYKCWRWQRKSF